MRALVFNGMSTHTLVAIANACRFPQMLAMLVSSAGISTATNVHGTKMGFCEVPTKGRKSGVCCPTGLSTTMEWFRYVVISDQVRAAIDQA